MGSRLHSVPILSVSDPEPVGRRKQFRPEGQEAGAEAWDFASQVTALQLP